MDFTVERAKLHCHTEQSVRDSAESITNLVKRAKEMGVPALALTNHGIVVGMPLFVKECKKNGIKAIVGVEGYYSDDNDKVEDTHICLYSTDYESYSYIGMALTEAGNRLSNGKPVFNTKILRKYFGVNSPVHNKVIMTSACSGGVFAKQMFANEKNKKEINSINKKLNKKNEEFNSDRYEELKAFIDYNNSELTKLKEEKALLSPIIKKTYSKEKKKVDKYKNINEEEYKMYLEAYNILIKERDNARKRYIELEEQIAELTNKNKEVKKEYDKLKTKKDGIEKYTNEKNSIDNLNLTEEDMYELMKKKAELMIEIFGKDNVYCEIQYHHLEDEKYAYKYVVDLANEYDLKLCTANDAHFAYNDKNSVRARQMLLSLRFDKYVEESIDHKEYYLKSDKELYDILSEIYSEEVIEKAFLGVEEISNRCNFEYPDEKHYPKYDGDANKDLREMCYANINERYGTEWNEEKEARLQHELRVIDKLGVADYICIVADFIKEGKKYGATHIGPGRGSAAGSVVCYLTHITNIDPFKYNLLFERFLNEDRVTMPDIDVDFSEFARFKVIKYCENKYGAESLCAIITEGTMAARNSIKNVAKFFGMEKGDSQLYSEEATRLANLVPKEVDITLEKCENQGLFDNLSEIEEEIITLAKVVEGTINSYGSHAAGIVIGDGGKISRHIPLKHIPATKDKPDTWVCQCDMIQVEELGCLKMDFLGLKTLDIITKSVKLIEDNKGVIINMDTIPFEKEVFSNIYGRGNTLGVFQTEGDGMSGMMKRLKPESIEDIIMAISVYRPGPMQYVDQIIARKSGKEKITYLCPELESILKNTYGCIVYQEQVMEIFKKLAGYSLSGADTIRRYMSKKKVDKLEAEKPIFVHGSEKLGIKGCVANGISEEIALKLFDEMADFAKYAFNKSHAAAYAIVSYQTAYLKHHYPAEFYAANLSVVAKEKRANLINEAKARGIEVELPNINESQYDFTVNDDKIIFGFCGIDGLDKAASEIVARRGFVFNSFKDFLERGHINIKTTTNLIKSGAFDVFSTNRKALLNNVDAILDIIKKINDKKKNIAKNEDLLTSDKENKSIKNRLAKAYNELNILEDYLKMYNIDTSIYEDELERLSNEYEVIGGVYISGHPLNNYNKPLNCTDISSISSEGYSGFIHLYGIVKNLQIRRKKSNNKEMAFFELEDTTGTVNVACFTNEYIKLGDMLKENAVLRACGKIVIEYRDAPTDDMDNTYETAEYQLILRECEVLQPMLPTIVLHVPNMIYYMENISSYMDNYKGTENQGMNLLIHDRMTGEFREYKYPVSSNFTEIVNYINNISITNM